jgi:cupin fold WbuC family metalloprotein
MDLISFHKKSEGVYVASQSTVTSDKNIVKSLSQIVKDGCRDSGRLLLHKSTEDILHQMIIIHLGGVYIRPHINLASDKSWHVIEGELILVRFDEAGNIKKFFNIGSYDSGLPFIVRLCEKEFHTLIPLTKHTVILETILGPFVESRYAEWAPQTTDVEVAKIYFDDICEKIGAKFE